MNQLSSAGQSSRCGTSLVVLQAGGVVKAPLLRSPPAVPGPLICAGDDRSGGTSSELSLSGSASKLPADPIDRCDGRTGHWSGWPPPVAGATLRTAEDRSRLSARVAGGAGFVDVRGERVGVIHPVEVGFDLFGGYRPRKLRVPDRYVSHRCLLSRVVWRHEGCRAPRDRPRETSLLSANTVHEFGGLSVHCAGQARVRQVLIDERGSVECVRDPAPGQ